MAPRAKEDYHLRMGDDKAFTGSIPKVYETYLVPLIFEQYAADLAERVAARLARSAADRSRKNVLEIAAGTGVVTRAMLRVLAPSAEIIATDLNTAMLEQAAAHTLPRPVAFQQADAMDLPFDDQAFDVVVIQFGVMFFPDKARALSEARRVLRPGGALIFNVWDRIEQNEFADVITEALVEFFPNDPPLFLRRTPYGYFDHATIARDLAAGGFSSPPEIVTVAARSIAKNASDPAVGYCHGSPLRAEIEARGALEHATDAAAKAIEARFGAGPIDTKIQAHVITVER
jgi:ubiquinone/menaquinone biosynthesis C-methylase UbiE